MTTTVLCRFGYGVPKAAVTRALRDAVKVQAENRVMSRRLGYNPNPVLDLTQEGSRHVYVPRCVGARFLGPPARERWSAPPAPVDAAGWEFAGALRPHQAEAVAAYEAKREGILCQPCGAGKTVAALAIACREGAASGRPVLVIVDEEDLMHQWAERIAEFVPRASIGMIQGERCEVEGKHFVIGMLQTLSRRDYPTVADIWGLLIVDECHVIGCAVYTQALARWGAPRVLGLSATPRRKDGLTTVMHMYLGPVVYSREPDPDPGVHVLQAYFRDENPAYATVPLADDGTVASAEQASQLAAWLPRNQFIWDIVLRFLKEDERRQVLLMSDRRELHLPWFRAAADAAGMSFGTYVGRKGAAKGKHRDAIVAARAARVIFGTYHKAHKGLDIKTLNCVAFLTSHEDVEQAAGRPVRVAGPDRVIAPLIMDFIDVSHPNLARQAAERARFYRKRGYTFLEPLNKEHGDGGPESE